MDQAVYLAIGNWQHCRWLLGEGKGRGPRQTEAGGAFLNRGYSRQVYAKFILFAIIITERERILRNEYNAARITFISVDF